MNCVNKVCMCILHKLYGKPHLLYWLKKYLCLLLLLVEDIQCDAADHCHNNQGGINTKYKDKEDLPSRLIESWWSAVWTVIISISVSILISISSLLSCMILLLLFLFSLSFLGKALLNKNITLEKSPIKLDPPFVYFRNIWISELKKAGMSSQIIFQHFWN